MNFDTSQLRAAHNFRLSFIRIKHTSQITRQQVIFLSYLIETGHTKDFLTRSIMIKGLSWELANQYLNKLKRIRYVTKQGRLWTLSAEGRQFYEKFMKEFNRFHEGAFSWR